MSGDIDRYVEEHRHRYTDAALRDRMIEAGYDADAVDAALRRIDPLGPSARGVVAFLLGLGGVLAFGGAILLALIYLGMQGQEYGPQGGGPQVVLLLYAVAMVVAIVLTIRVLAKAGGTQGSWLGVGGSAVLGVVLFFGLSGACIVGLQATT